MSWSELLPEMLAAIAKKLTEPADYLRFRSVCSNWHAAAHSVDIPPFPKISLLILPSDPSSTFRHIYSFSEDRLYRFHLPDYARETNLLRGSASGWLLASRDEKCFHLFHPFTPFSVVSKFSWAAIGFPTDPHCMSWDLSASSVAFCLRNWKHGPGVKSITHCEGNFYVLWDKKPIVQITNLDRSNPIAIIDPPHTLVGDVLTADLAISPDELFLLVRLEGCDLPYSHIFWLDRHKFADGEEWTEVKGIGNRAIFVDSLHCFLVEAGESTGLMKNCIYSVVSKTLNHNSTLQNVYIQQFNFDDMSSQILERKLSQYVINGWTCTFETSWFMPSLECKKN
ncbi:hypothetical protein LUZ63_009792 [Rhynchospora breviuscula]|uniref:KIB1-4 beta-propeller domain-containing protein n=1 Tax=Rhynchospora breviuscula TaxID=2022672 RepID=A0A9Q0CGJ0_9POAL|nr:hypothetical protein LUZ63_009792 [Rhynchospora breviuscula]